MNFLAVYVNLIRVVFVGLAVYYIFKRDFKKMKSAVIVFILTFLLVFLEKILHIQIDAIGGGIYYTVLFLSIYLGSELGFYDKYSWWDRALHFLCGIMFVSFGVPLGSKMGITSQFWRLFFCLTLSTTLHVFWEIAEYIVDCISRTDHQRWQKHSKSKNHVSEKAIQPAGLVDTMNDIIICMIGTIASCVVWWFL